jgi:squalene synthase HpnC
MTDNPVETPSGKGAADENFPVGSWLLPAALRPHVATYYAFARAIDDIADNPALAAEDKIARLTAFEAALTDPTANRPGLEKASRLRASLAATGVTAARGTDLVAAFKQDAVKRRYADWAELIGYCRLSANPVGRYLLDLHGEDPAGYPASDALCTALQILNHLQDCQDDYRALDRVYLPQDWLAAEGLDVGALEAAASPPGFRRLLDRCLDGVDRLLAEASQLPGQLRSARLAMESAIIVQLARRLARRLRAGDPLAGRVALSRADFLLCGLKGICGVQLGRLTGRHQPAGQRG